MDTERRIDVAGLIDHRRIGGFQIGIMVLCGLCLIMDGFDVQAMGYVAPALIQEFGVDKAGLGPVFGAGLAGMLVGSLVLSLLADRIGRRPVLIGATFYFSLCMLATTQAHDLTALQWLRFVTGIGLGAIMPNAMALVCEYSPQRRRIGLMMTISCGFTAGAVLGGLVAAALIGGFGWRAVFWVGGLVPLVIGVAMLRWLPESLQFLALRDAGGRRLAAAVRRIAPDAAVPTDARFMVPAQPARGVAVTRLFHDGRAFATVLLWLINFMNLLDLYFLSNWLPTVVREAGFSIENAVLAGTVLQVGGTVGTLAMGPVIDRIGFFRVLVPGFVMAGVAIAAVGQPFASLTALCATIFVIGFCIMGGQPAINALAASVYPTAMRSTGVGWSLGIGRFGSILGPVLGGILLQMHWSTGWIFALVAIPAAVSAGALLVMSRVRSGPTATTAEPVTP